jgi:hypothetical protein
VTDAQAGILVVYAVAGACAIALVVLIATRLRSRGPRGGPGPGAAGAVYELLSEDRRNAIEIIVEQRAEAREPEDKDGNLPRPRGQPIVNAAKGDRRT